MADPNYVDPALLRLISDRKQAIWLRIGALHEVMNSPDRALAAYETCLSHNQSNVQGLIKAGTLHMKKESIPSSIAYLTSAVSLDSDNSLAWGALAYSYVMAEEFDKAYEAYYNAFSKMPDQRDPSFWFGVGILYDRMGMLDHGLAAYNAVLDLSPSYERMDEVLYSIGLIYKEKGNHNASYQYMAKIISLNSTANAQAEAWYQLGTLHDITGDINAASDAYHSALSRNQNHVKAIHALAWLIHKNGSDQEAVEMLQRALRIDDSNGESYYLIGRIYMANNEFRVAYDNYQRAVHLDPKNAFFWCSIASLYYQRTQYRDAMDAYSRAIQIYPDIPEVWYDLGTLYELYSQFNDAADSYRRALQMQPQNSLVSHRLQLVQNSLVSGVAPPRPNSKPACDGPEISPTTRLGQRPHIKSDAPTRYGPLPTPPGPPSVPQPATGADHHQAGQQPDQVPATCALQDDRHLQSTRAAASVPNSFPAVPGYANRPTGTPHNGNMPNASNVTVVGPESGRESSFPQGPVSSMPTASRPMPPPAKVENQHHEANRVSTGMAGAAHMATVTAAGAADSRAMPIPPSRSASQAPLSPNLRDIPRSSPEQSASVYSDPERTHVNGADNHEQLGRGSSDWKSRNGKVNLGNRSATGPDGQEGNERVPPTETNMRVNVSSVETRTDVFPYPANSSLVGSTDADRGRNLNQGAPQVPTNPSASLPQSSSEFYNVLNRSRPLSRFSNGAQANSLPGISRLGEDPRESDDHGQDGTVSANPKTDLTGTSAEEPSRMLGVSPVPKDAAPTPTPGGAQIASRDMLSKGDVRNNSAEGNHAQAAMKGNSGTDFQQSPRLSPPGHSNQFPSNPQAKEDSPVDEEMLPRLRPLPSPSSRTADQGQDGAASNGEHVMEKPKGTDHSGNVETNHHTEPSTAHGSDSGRQVQASRESPDAGLRSQPEPPRQSRPESDVPRSTSVPRSGFNTIIQEPSTSQSRIYKSSGFSEYKGPRAGISFTKAPRSVRQDDILQKGNIKARPNGDVDNGGKGGSPAANISRDTADSRSPTGFGGSDDTRERCHNFAASPLPGKAPEGSATPSNRASPEHRDGPRQSPRQGGSLGSGASPNVQASYDVGSSREKVDKGQPHRTVAPTGIRSSLAAVGAGIPIPMKRTVFRREEDKKGGENSDRDAPGDSQNKIQRVSSLRNPFGSGISPSFSRPAPRISVGGGLGITAVKEPGVHDPNSRQGPSEVLKLKGGGEVDMNGSRQEGNRGQMSKLGKRSAACLENGSLRSGEGSDLKRFMPKSAVIGPSIENRMRSSDVELQEPRFLGSSSQYIAGRSGSQDSKLDKNGEPNGSKRFSGGEL